MGMGAGGATGQTSLEIYQQNTHSMLLMGKTADVPFATGKDWEGNEDVGVYSGSGTYKDNPSVLRFVYDKGITDAGGNPFEGVSSYDPATDLSATDADFATYLAGVGSLDPLNDWNNFITSALSRNSEVNEELDINTLATDIVDRAISKAGEVITQANVDGSNISQVLLDNINLRSNAVADTEASESIRQGEIELTSLITNAVSKGLLSSSGVVAGLVSEHGGETLNTDIMDKVSPRLTAVLGAMLSDIQSKTGTMIDAVDTDTLPDTVIAAVKADLTSLEDGIEAKTTQLANSNTSAGDVKGEEIATGRTGGFITLTSAASGVLEPAAREAAKESMGSVISAINPVVDSVVTNAPDIAAIIEPAIREAGKTSMTSVMGVVDPKVSNLIHTAISELRSSMGGLMQEAATSVFNLVDTTSIDAAIKIYRKRVIATHMRSVNRFAGGMADIGAVNSSAFITGMALLESDHSNNIDDFRAKLELQLYNTAITTGMAHYIETLNSMVGQYLNSYERRFAQHLDVYKTDADIYARVFSHGLDKHHDSYERRFSQNLDVYKMSTNTYLQTFLSVLPEYVKTYLTSFTQYVSSAEQLLQTTGQTKAPLIQSLGGIRERLSSDLTKLSVGVSTSLVSTQLQSTLGLTESESKTILQLISEHSGLIKGGSNQYVNSVLNYAGNRLNAYSTNAALEADTFEKVFVPRVQTAVGLAGSELVSAVRTKLTEKQGKIQVALDGAHTMGGFQSGKIDSTYKASMLSEHINRARVVATSEEYAKDLLYDVNSSNWDMELYQKAANVLAGVSGAVVSSAGKPSDTQTVLGSMAAGGSIGAAAGVGGAAIGSAVGLLAGFASID